MTAELSMKTMLEARMVAISTARRTSSGRAMSSSWMIIAPSEKLADSVIETAGSRLAALAARASVALGSLVLAVLARVAGLDVVDMACGEGYGAALMRAAALLVSRLPGHACADRSALIASAQAEQKVHS